MSRFRRLLAGVAVLGIAAGIGASTIVANSDRERIIALHNIHNHETISVLYKKDGKYVASGLEKVNWIMRDWRRNEATTMDPELIDLLWEMHAELGSKEPIHIISGYRSRNTNEMLRKSVGGQASQSRHILGKAADVHFPDVPLKNLRYSALIRERGGVGYYPTSAIPFVHVDTDRVRAWPRLPRYELALLFPQGRTQHQPADGQPISKDDVRVAREQHKELATQIAEFRALRDQPKAPITVAARSDRGAPKIVLGGSLASTSTEQTADASARRSPLMPSADERARLNDLAALASMEPRLLVGPTPAARRPPQALASLTGGGLASIGIPHQNAGPQNAGPRLVAINPADRLGSPRVDANNDRGGWGSGWVAAPAYDEEHPEELSYRPFPIGPLLTTSVQDPILAELVHHDVARTLEMLDQPGTVLPLRFRPGEQLAQLMWAQQFRGEAVGLPKLFEAQDAGAEPLSLNNRPVRTTRR